MVTVAAVPLVIAAAGFTASGIAATSFGAWLMSVTAVANGGGVVAGGLVSILQSIGVLGVSTAGKVVLGTTGGVALAATCRKLKCG